MQCTASDLLTQEMDQYNHTPLCSTAIFEIGKKVYREIEQKGVERERNGIDEHRPLLPKKNQVRKRISFFFPVYFVRRDCRRQLDEKREQ